jgi:predicted metal-dependent hydrolase
MFTQKDDHHLPVPVRIYIENRKAARIALGKKNIIIRMPKSLNKLEAEKIQKKFLDWAAKTIHEKGLYTQQHTYKNYKNMDSIRFLGVDYVLQIQYISGNTCRIRIGNEPVIKCFLPSSISDNDVRISEEVSKLFKKVIPKYFTYSVWQRLSFWNDKYFNVEVPKLTLRYTNSRWGSCSKDGKISISMRLLLAPLDVLDYVLIHELAHRKEMNHSAKFWQWCAIAMPDYKEKEQHLKAYGRDYFL